MYKYGVISTASIVKRFIDGVRLAGDEVVCIGSRDINKAKQFASENNIEKYNKFNEKHIISAKLYMICKKLKESQRR